MHILHVTLGFYPAQSWGGPVKIVHQNSKELVRRGHEVTIYCTNLLNKKQKIKPKTFEQYIDGIRVVYMDTINLPWWPGTLGPIWIPDLRTYFKKEIDQYDVIHINGYRSPMSLITARAARSAGIPFITQPHGSLPIMVNTFFLKRIYDILFEKIELGGLSALIALQESERLQALNHGIPENLIEVIPNGIELPSLNELPEKGKFRRCFNISANQQIILFLGRINKIKGTDMLIEAFFRMSDPNVRLIIAGPDDGQLSELHELVNKYKMESAITFTGLLTGQDVYAAFLDADLFVLPSRSDTFPTTIMESCLMGTPMVITDRCKIAYLVKDRVGDVVPFDAQRFADAMALLLTKGDRYKRYKSNCQSMITEIFSIQTVVDRLEAVYQRAVDKKSKNKGNHHTFVTSPKKQYL